MTAFTTRTTLLAAALGLLLTGTAAAQTPAKRDAAAEKELAAAQAELNRAAKRVAELSMKAGKERMQQARVERIIDRRPVVGVLLAPDAQAGVRIAGVTPDSAAAKAGLKSGDRLVSVNSARILGDTGELRLRNARKLLGGLEENSSAKLGYERDGRGTVVSVTPRAGDRVVMLPDFDGAEIGRVITLSDLGDIETEYFAGLKDLAVDLAPEIEREIVRLGSIDPCKGDRCKAPMLLSAFRWNGLNLASVDPQLGRYFGTDKGVLVLSAGELDGLQAGDVIQKIDGRTVNNPREAMDALRDKPADATVAMTYLRDRKPGSTRIKVPRLMAFPPLPPAPPAPPRAPKPPTPPKPPTGALSAPPTPPAPPAPPPAPAKPSFAGNADAVTYMLVDKDGHTHTYSWRDQAELDAAGAVKTGTR
ncbi:PDZ domain-containing protein [Luteimonas cucumeris]|uniref:PDZ domain-containing protein n=1 Tax=Luteimonas cucumeris TaxID=985012 RepID=A0A562LFA4_9GAMM|nr:PDZ domain-containing protein [Luteimonas cucumeris]TWI06301.1 PDZ domain-containing protein [Luteimonas cucumeris]